MRRFYRNKLSERFPEEAGWVVREENQLDTGASFTVIRAPQPFVSSVTVSL